MGRHRGVRNDWSDHFSVNAVDLIRVQLAFAGPEVAKTIMLRCFKRRRNTESKINERTVLAVLDGMSEKEMK